MGSKIKFFLKAGLLAAVPLFLFGALWLWSGESKASPLSANSGIILFFGKECPHCQDLEETIEKEGFSDKVSFDSLEIWHNRGNRKIFSEKAEECGLSEDQLGVPLLYAKGECFVGSPEIEKFLKKEAGIE